MAGVRIHSGLRAGMALAATLAGLLGAMPGDPAAEEAPVLRTAKEVFRPDEPIYVFIDNPPTNNWAWLTVAKPGAHNMEHGDRIYLKDHAPAERRNRWYTLPPQGEGEYELRLFLRNNLSLGATLPIRVAAPGGADPSEGFVTAYADRLIEFVAGNQSRYPEPFGHTEGPFSPKPVDPAIVLGDPGPGPFTSANRQVEFLTLPRGSHVTVAFSGHVLLDGPGPDFFVRALDPAESAGEVAEVLVSTDLKTFVFLDQVRAAGLQPLDLAGLGLTAPVSAIRVVGTDLKGSYPGFELVSLELAHAVARDQFGSSAGSPAASPKSGGTAPPADSTKSSD